MGTRKPSGFKFKLLIPVLSIVFVAVACGAAATATPFSTSIPSAATTPRPTSTVAATSLISATTGPIGTATTTPAVKVTSVPARPATKVSVGRLKIAVGPPANETNDPSQTSPSSQWQSSPMYEHLLRVSPTGEIVPMLATNYIMSPDAKTWTINLRKGVPWQANLGEFTAKDLVHSLQILTRDGSLTSMAGVWRRLLELPKKTDRIEVVDDYQVKLHLTQPYLSLPSLLTSEWDLWILSKAHFDALGAEGWAKKPVGTGPYEFVDRKPGQSLLYKRGEGRHWRVTPDFAEIQMLFVREEAANLAMLLTDEVHVAVGISSDLEKQAVAKGKKVVFSTLPNSFLAVVFSGNYLPTVPAYKPDVPWTKKVVREAMNRAVNRPELRDAIFGGRGDLLIVDSLHPSVPGWNATWPKQFDQSYWYDPARAKALLKEAGYPQGFKVDLAVARRPTFTQIVSLAEAIATYWRAIGLDVKITEYEFATVRDRSRKSELYDPWVVVSPYRLNPVDAYSSTYYSKGDVNHRFNSAVIDQKFEEISTSLDIGQQDRLLREIGEFMFSEHAALPLFWVNGSLVTDPRVVAEYSTSGLPYLLNDMEYFRATR